MRSWASLLVLVALVTLGCTGDEIKGGDDTGSDSGIADGSSDLDSLSEAGELTGDVGAAEFPPDLIGAACESDEQCKEQGKCFEAWDGMGCTAFCSEECPALHTCKEPGEGESSFCVPWYSRLCMPCTSGDDCIPAGVASLDVGARCVKLGGEGSFCAGRCGSDGSCPDGYVCADASVGEGAVMKLCLPESGKCECSPFATSLEAETVCSVANEHGECAAERSCTADGLSECTADVPEAEKCDGEDNDCDTVIDEELGETTCGLGACEHTVANCANGKELACDPMDGASDEECDLADNDCDGDVDEELGQTICGLGACEHTIDNCVEGELQECDPMEGVAEEICDAADNDCDGLLNEDLGSTTCGLGVCEVTVDNCVEGVVQLCEPPDLASDEACDGLDNDCDGAIDQGFEDTDSDAVADCVDPDDDGDSVLDEDDNCPLVANEDQADFDLDGFGDVCDSGCWLGEEGGWETDCDQIPDGEDNCPSDHNPGQLDTDGDLAGDACDGDDDGDGVEDGSDNCPLVPNPGQENLDQDAFGDICDDDDDGDEHPDTKDNCPMAANADQLDTDMDDLGDACDDDDDGDGDPDVTDCAPLDPAISLLQVEACNELDDDCDLVVDEEGATGCEPWYADTDGDGWGVEEDSKCLCGPSEPHTAQQTGDCNPGEASVFPGAQEACNGVDDDCDSQTDEESVDTDADGIADCVDDDDDGDGIEDAQDNCILVANQDQTDTDGDLAGDMCDDDDDGDGTLDGDDCNPLSDLQAPGLPETCDALDNDCNELVDDGLGTTTCGLGVCEHIIENCLGGIEQQCDPFEGKQDEGCDTLDNDCDGQIDEELGSTTCGLGVCEHTVENCMEGQTQICDDLEGASAEVCDGLDNDCNGQEDDGLGSTTCGLGVCEHTVENCKDAQEQICDEFLGKEDEVCDGLDNDCDGNTDEDLGSTTCGLGDCEHTVENCMGGKEQVCDEFEGKKDEVCDGFDNDCDGKTDEGFEDFDEDGTPDCIDTDDDNDLSPDEADCDDHNPLAYPGAKENCDKFDNDCNGWIDEGCPGSVSGKDCKSIHADFPAFTSGLYTIDPDGPGGAQPVEVTCDMATAGGGWTRIADVDTSKTGCPKGWVLTNFPKVCFRNITSAGCKSSVFETFGVTFGEVRGFVRAYQYYSMDAFHAYAPQTIDGPYVDGVSITYGSPRKHVWTYAVGVSEDGNYPNYNCPCAKYPGGGPPSFVGTDYYCESGNSGAWENAWYTADPLFDGQGCPSGNNCCANPNLPWFTKSLGASVMASLEARLCSDQPTADEDVGVYEMELWVR